MTSSNSRLIAAYNKLSAAEQHALKALAVALQPISQTRLSEILRAAGGPNPPVIKTWREKMQRLALIEKDAQGLSITPALTNFLVFEALADGSYEALYECSEGPYDHFAYRHYYNRSTQLESWAYQRQLRDALLRGDNEAFMTCMGLTDPYADPPFDELQVMLKLCNQIRTDWFAVLPDAMQYQVLSATLEATRLQLVPAEGFTALLKQFSTHQPTEGAVAALIAEDELFRLVPVTVTVEAKDAFSLRVQGAMQFMAGDEEQAVKLYRQSLTARRRETDRRETHVPGLHGLLYCLALTRLGGPKYLKYLDTQFKAAGKVWGEPLSFGYHLLRDFREVWDGREPSDYLSGFSEHRQLSHLYPHNLLTLGLLYHWLDEPPTDSVRAALDGLQEVAANQPWFNRELTGLLTALDGGTTPPEAQLPGLMPRLRTWERALQSLTDLSPTGAQAKPAATDSPEVRLAWLLTRDEWDGITLEPREQKQRKQGAWTKGRPVALSRLSESPESLDYLTPQDLAICRTIRQSHSGYHGVQRYLPTGAALAAAAGHSAIFWSDDLATPVEINRCQPELRVTEAGEHITLSIFPNPNATSGDEDDVLYDQDTRSDHVLMERPGGMDVYEFTDRHHEIARILGNGLQVPASAREQVVRSITAVSPLLTVHGDFGGIESAAEAVAADATIHINLQPQGEGLRLDIGVQPFGGAGPRFLPGSGGETVFAEIDGRKVQTTRDLDAERAARDRVIDACPGLEYQHGDIWLFPDLEPALTGLLALQEMEPAPVLAWPQGKPLRLHPQAGVSAASMTVRSHRDWFEFDGELRISDGEVLGMQRLLELLDTAPGRFIRLGEGEFLALTQELDRRLQQLRTIGGSGKVHRLAGIHLDEITDSMNTTADARFRQFRKQLAIARDFNPEVPATFEADLRDYQVEGFKWLAKLAAWGAGACLADDMGLGKTVQSLALIVSRASEGPTLVLAPTSVCLNWVEEAQRFAPALAPRVFGAGDRGKILDALGPFDLLICSYGLLTSEAERLGEINWQTIVADEAQAFKNTNTLRSKAVMSLSASFRMIVTGTPVENHLGELWNLFNFINPGLLGSRESFTNTFARPIENGDESAQSRLRQLLSPFVLRRLKRDVLKELPPRTEILQTVELSREEEALYEALRREAKEQILATDKENTQRMIALAQITRLRQAACHPALVMPEVEFGSSKLEALGEIITELIENHHRALVFSQFVRHLDLVRAYLDQRDVAYQYLDGSMRPADRNKAVNAFQGGDGDVFLISLRAGGTGLNLTAANYVIHLDPWWNPAVEDQASDRAHRLGQQRPVTIYRLVAANTIEQRIVELHRQKRELADSLLEGSDTGAKLTLDDMLALLD